jgi:hypothetical protein
MPLWNSSDANTGAPKFPIFGGLGVHANGNILFGNVQIGAFRANVALDVDGITPAAKANTRGPQHAGWVSKIFFTGPITTIAVSAAGKGYTNGFVTFANGGTGNTSANASYSVLANGSVDTVNITNGGNGYSNGFLTITAGGIGNSAANISYTVNATGGIVSLTINNGGSNYDSVPTVQALGANVNVATLFATVNTGTIVSVTLITGGSYSSTPNASVANANSQATFTVTGMGGRANRIQYETLVAMSSMH